MNPSQRTVHRARLTISMRKVSDDLEYFRVVEITPRKVIFFFGGYRIQFEDYQGRVARMGGDNRYISVDDYALMFKLAEMLMSANIRGINANRKGKANMIKEGFDDRQGKLPLLPPFNGRN